MRCQVADNLGGLPSPNFVDNVWSFSYEFAKLLTRTPDQRRKTAIADAVSTNSLPVQAAANTTLSDFLGILTKDKVIKIPDPLVDGSPTAAAAPQVGSNFQTAAQRYVAFWTADGLYTGAFQGTRYESVFSSEGYRNLTSVFRSLPTSEQSYDTQLARRTTVLQERRTQLAQVPGTHCSASELSDATLAGAAMMDEDYPFWPDVRTEGRVA